jgi:hypothetical protein
MECDRDKGDLSLSPRSAISHLQADIETVVPSENSLACGNVHRIVVGLLMLPKKLKWQDGMTDLVHRERKMPYR